MKSQTVEYVTHTHCDVCGTDVTGTIHYGQEGKDYCAQHKPWSFADIVKDVAVRAIMCQPFFTGNIRKGAPVSVYHPVLGR